MPPPDRLPGIEGLRALAATAVVVHHTWILPGGERVGADAGAGAVFLNLALGVTLFFALSGYLLYRPFAAAIARRAEMPRIRRYLRNRGLRILPAYWAILVATSLLLMTAGTREAGGRLEFGVLIDPLPLLKAALLIHNYHPDTVVIGIGPAWSLAVEAVFYVVLPLMALVAARAALRCRARSGRVIVLLAPPLLLLLIGLSGKYMAGVVVPAAPGAGYGANWHSVIERSFWAQADLFAFGMLTAVLHTEITDGRFVLPRGWRVVALALAVAIFAPCALSLDSGQLGYRLENTAVGLAAALLIAAVTFPGGPARGPLLQRILELPAVVMMGLISYSVFLWNDPVLRWLSEHGATREGWAGLAWNLGLAAVVVGALSLLSYRFVELPALRRKHRRPPMRAEQIEAAP